MYPIILASSSPRRQELLKLMNIPFIVQPADIDETYPDTLCLEKVPEYISTEKVKKVLESVPKEKEHTWILGADTAILFEDKIYGKPKNQEEAFSFLKTLQGKTHSVITGMTLYNGETKTFISRTCSNKVTFAPMTDEEIEWYISSGEWYSAAGAYRIQGIGSCFIKKIEGSESGIMGLPLFELYDILKSQNYSLIEE